MGRWDGSRRRDGKYGVMVQLPRELEPALKAAADRHGWSVRRYCERVIVGQLRAEAVSQLAAAAPDPAGVLGPAPVPAPVPAPPAPADPAPIPKRAPAETPAKRRRREEQERERGHASRGGGQAPPRSEVGPVSPRVVASVYRGILSDAAASPFGAVIGEVRTRLRKARADFDRAILALSLDGLIRLSPLEEGARARRAFHAWYAPDGRRFWYAAPTSKSPEPGWDAPGAGLRTPSALGGRTRHPITGEELG